MSRGKCGHCIHLTELPGQKNMRFCTCKPPQVILIPRQSALQPQQMNLAAEATWPPIGSPDFGCGCFEKADDDVILIRELEIDRARKDAEDRKIVSINRPD